MRSRLVAVGSQKARGGSSNVAATRLPVQLLASTTNWQLAAEAATTAFGSALEGSSNAGQQCWAQESVGNHKKQSMAATRCINDKSSGSNNSTSSRCDNSGNGRKAQ